MEQLGELAQLINKDLDPGDEKMLIPVSDLDINMLKEKLSVVILYMLENQFEKLCNVMYRLDVSEQKFSDVLNKYPPQEAAPAIAELVIEREMMKVRTRMLYRNKQL